MDFKIVKQSSNSSAVQLYSYSARLPIKSKPQSEFCYSKKYWIKKKELPFHETSDIIEMWYQILLNVFRICTTIFKKVKFVSVNDRIRYVMLSISK